MQVSILKESKTQKSLIKRSNNNLNNKENNSKPLKDVFLQAHKQKPQFQMAKKRQWL